jgi:hypothetical protein
MSDSDLDCAFHLDGVPDAPCVCYGIPWSFAAVPIVAGEVIKESHELDSE